MTQQEDYCQKLSKLLTRALRHAPEDYGLEFGRDGWVPLTDLENAFNARWNARSIEEVVHLSMHNGTPRFELREDAHGDKFIRATRGHTFSSARKEPKKQDEADAELPPPPLTSCPLQPPPPPPGPPPQVLSLSPPPKPPGMMPPSLPCNDEPQSALRSQPRLMLVSAAFDGYTWGPEYLQVNPPTCDGKVGDSFSCLPHEEADSDWIYGQFQGGRAGWLPTAFVEGSVTNQTSPSGVEGLDAASEKLELLEREAADLRRQVQQAGIQKHEF